MAKELWKGNEAIAEAALRAGVEAYFGYPITPQTELLEYMAREIPKYPGRVFLQAESELAAVNMVYGAACAGVRVLSSSSSPGISLMTEGLSYIAGTEVPAVLVDIMRGGPGLGNIMPSQGDYFQMTKALGHGDFHPIVLAPSTVQEAVDLTYGAFELAETYRTVVVILADGAIGQMMEPVVMPPARPVMTEQERADWALRGAKDRERRILTSLHLSAEGLERMNQGLQNKLARIQQKELRWQETMTDDADLLLVAFGTAGRVCTSVVSAARRAGLKVGLLRPISLWPFPEQRLVELAERVQQILVVEMNAGQMVLDVKAAVAGRAPVHFYGRMGGVVPLPDEISAQIDKLVSEPAGGTGFKTGSNNGYGQPKAMPAANGVRA
ncbi:MAG: 3-methyl-2-oxobutanoate dehydrogenase subunit VorB [Caldilineae bacterium]|nr:3-methyl-2-oxobutanoate dehydrogenase subunit VorB [Anaerolineae bacterium]MCB0198767.1 3-methyl-2-oxobutanoate dehydrogenase subunit VorB [Anaerolineae bacterium]MCB0203438.1 3-methyl-2-oxobutanoate dehydrogenase subunit VorB [Anaerolineae bacterium]MCB9154311.1 3-methyl-2-oxobutanoate dehydrogenase subunit VorB [Caldilineae bacterium]